ncbi:hypothetical protein DOT_5501 [Desulfosporosinus sp. OT]|nr:hypothetical protein DOT_5501 [Desulfosporosinus sp. OT]
MHVFSSTPILKMRRQPQRIKELNQKMPLKNKNPLPHIMVKGLTGI